MLASWLFSYLYIEEDLKFNHNICSLAVDWRVEFFSGRNRIHMFKFKIETRTTQRKTQTHELKAVCTDRYRQT